MTESIASLVKKCLTRWPKQISTEIIDSTENNDSFYTPQLSEIFDELDESCIGTQDEFPMRNIHKSIFICLRNSARNAGRVFLNEIHVKDIYVVLLKDISESSISDELGYDDKDRELKFICVNELNDLLLRR